MRTITLNGKEFKLAYNLKAACAYENMTGKNPFNTKQEDIASNELNYVVTVGYCMLLANNDPYNVPELEEFMTAFDNVSTTMELVTAINEEIQLYFRPTAKQVEATKKKGKKAKKEEEAPKNS